ncbi:laccase domain-containing protein, partial [Streptococcus suis]|uniref:laccase domain-containing protein n=1 Tax=Streptococcus suis TaxID=1307 RepID=UPI00370A4874
MRLLTQVHGTDILPSNTPEKEPAGDGWLVQTPGAVGIKTGDCLPILWAHPSTRSACALHCG